MADESKIFTLAGQGLKLDSRADIEPFLEKLRTMDQVEEVHLGGNTLGVEACKALAEVLAEKKSLKVADLADIFTGRLISEIPESLSALCDALASHPNLTEVNLSDNAFGGRSAEPMVKLLSENTALSILKLNNNGLGPAGGEIVARALLASAEKSKKEAKKSNLQVVICGRNRLEDSAKVWAEAFAAHGTLREVTMQNDGIRMGAMVALLQGLAECHDLELLDLQDNTLTEITDEGRIDLEGPRLVARLLPGWPKLKVLNLSDCVLKPRGGEHIAGALAKGSNPLLETLKLENSEVDHQTFGLLAEAISLHLPGLTLLELNANKGDPDHESLKAVRVALATHGNEDALGELDEMEEVDEEEEEELYVEVFPEQEKADRIEEVAEPEVVPPEKEEPDVAAVAEELEKVKLSTPKEEEEATQESAAVPVAEESKKEEPQTASEPTVTSTLAPPLEATALAAPPAAAVSLPPSSAPITSTETPSPAPAPSATENGTPTTTTATPASKAAEPASAAPAAASSSAPPVTPMKQDSEKAVRKRRSILGPIAGLGDRLAGVFSPKRRVSQAPK